ncbi:uncharacterized protein LOC123315317 [Coccinella septempunctata]|uniref:uncharacterized protein LOC123315317 n=1 Tax=Coccinella septempunctata TaxID=41139 RepID=UPI001D0886DE|nr:uncharacterized protein LOC123315317 [Coccinella septempunctata]
MLNKENLLRVASLSLVLVIILQVEEGYSLKCWVCCSEADPQCAEPFNNSTFQLMNCHRRRSDGTADPRPSLCTRIKQRVDGRWQYIRSCGVQDDLKIQQEDIICKTRTYPGDVIIEYCTCNSEDGCNG